MTAIHERRAEPVAILALTSHQRASVRYGLGLSAPDRAKFESAEPGVRRIVLTTAELEDLRRRLDEIRPHAVAPHARRFDAIARRVDAVLQPHRAKLRELAATNEPPPRPRPVPGLVFQFRVALLGIEPPIWRRFLVEDCDLREFHHIVRMMVGWTWDIEPHLFEFDGVQYGPHNHDGTAVTRPLVEESDVLLSGLFPRASPPTTGRYEYDFTAGWQHELAFEGHRAWDFDTDYPACLEGERDCPPEGTGGVEGYRRFLRGAAADPERILGSVPKSRRPFDP